MTLKEYLVKHKLTARWVAGKAHVTVSAARKWVQGIRTPRLAVMKIIHRITNGEVSYDDWT